MAPALFSLREREMEKRPDGLKRKPDVPLSPLRSRSSITMAALPQEAPVADSYISEQKYLNEKKRKQKISEPLMTVLVKGKPRMKCLGGQFDLCLSVKLARLSTGSSCRTFNHWGVGGEGVGLELQPHVA